MIYVVQFSAQTDLTPYPWVFLTNIIHTIQYKLDIKVLDHKDLIEIDFSDTHKTLDFAIIYQVIIMKSVGCLGKSHLMTIKDSQPGQENTACKHTCTLAHTS